MNRLVYALAASLLMATPALAHIGPGAVHDFAGGVLHPLTGVDHLLAAIGVGLWAMLVDRERPWIWPLTFVGVMALAAALGAQGIALPYVDIAIAGTVIALGLLIAGAVQVSTLVGAIVVAVLAMVHGYAHGAEGGSAWPYLAGIVAATALLHVLGLVTAGTALAFHRPLFIRVAGAAVALAGIVLFIA